MHLTPFTAITALFLLLFFSPHTLADPSNTNTNIPFPSATPSAPVTQELKPMRQRPHPRDDITAQLDRRVSGIAKCACYCSCESQQPTTTATITTAGTFSATQAAHKPRDDGNNRNNDNDNDGDPDDEARRGGSKSRGACNCPPCNCPSNGAVGGRSVRAERAPIAGLAALGVVGFAVVL